jgi:Bardet-Biedl syndrome 2 protein
VADCNDARIRLAADMADDSQRVKVRHRLDVVM